MHLLRFSTTVSICMVASMMTANRACICQLSLTVNLTSPLGAHAGLTQRAARSIRVRAWAEGPHSPCNQADPPINVTHDNYNIRSFFFPSNAFMASARSFNMFYCMLQIGIN